MDLMIQKEILVNGIQTVQNAITQKSSLPVLSNVLLETDEKELKLTATDLDIGICSMLPVTSSQSGAVSVPARKFFDIVRSLPENEQINLSIKKNNSISIKSGKAQFKMMGLPRDDFPSLPVFKNKDEIIVPQNVLKEMLNLTDFAISKDDARHVLTGILFTVNAGTITIVATDGRRMAVIKKELSQKTPVDKTAIIPLKTVQEVKRLLGEDGDVKIKFSENQVMFSLSSSFVISRLIEGEYPDYRKVIPEKSTKIATVSRVDFLAAARRASIFTDQDSQAVKISIQKTKMTISKNTPYLGEARDDVKISYSGEKEIEIGFNPRYLIDVLRNMEDDDIAFELNDPTRPGVIRKGEDYIYVVLPMQLVV